MTNDRLVMDFGQAAGLAHAVAFGDVFVNGDDGVVGQRRPKKDGALAFGEGLLAMGAVEQAGLVFAVGAANADIFFTANAVFRTLFIPTEKVFQVVHDYSIGNKKPENTEEKT